MNFPHNRKEQAQQETLDENGKKPVKGKEPREGLFPTIRVPVDNLEYMGAAGAVGTWVLVFRVQALKCMQNSREIQGKGGRDNQ